MILDDEKYFTLSGYASGNSRYYSSDPSPTPTSIKFKQKQKYERHLLVSLAIFCQGVSSPFIYRSKIARREETYVSMIVLFLSSKCQNFLLA